MAVTKIDRKQELRELYGAGREPALVEVPELSFLMLDGHGDPAGTPAFVEGIQALYSVAYTARFAIRRERGEAYVVMPLEALFDTPDASAFDMVDKAGWAWTLMIVQPEFMTSEVFETTRAEAAAKRPLEAMAKVRLERFAEGLAAQILHVGPYATEGPTIERLHAFIGERGFVATGRHHEIYLSDPNRCAPEKLRTIIRQSIRRR